jgi:hypothetical protein
VRVSGKFAAPGNLRNEKLGSVPGMSGSGPGARPTGIAFPFAGQPVQGFSGIKHMVDGTYWVLTDNGFGNKANSHDALLMAHRLKPDWASGKVERLETVFLHDPDRLLPFPIVHEGTTKRYLTGGDLDIESLQPVGDALWFADEFGPFLVRTDLRGKVTGFWQTEFDGKPIRSPDHPAVRTPGAPGGAVSFNVGRSKGFEGMAASPDGRFLYPLLEGPLWVDGKPEKVDGIEALPILEFDTGAAKWSGRHWRYRLEADGHAIGDFNMIDATRPGDRARQRRGQRGARLPRRRAGADLLRRSGKVQARLPDQHRRRRGRRRGQEARPYRPDGDRRSGQEGAPRWRRWQLRLPVLHHRECRPGRRAAHHRRQRQQSAVLRRPPARPRRRQRDDPAPRAGIAGGAVSLRRRRPAACRRSWCGA